MLSLDDLARRTQTDKVWHGYTRIYDRLFDCVRDKPIALLEIGVLGGDSIKMWDDYFTHPETRIVGVDIETHRCNQKFSPRVQIIQGDAGNPDFIRSLPHPFDICIEDGPHFYRQQVATFETLFPLLKPHGVFALEDTHSAMSSQHCDGPETILDYFARIVREMQDPAGATGCAKVQPTDKWASIKWITFHKGLAVVKRA